MVGQHLDGGGVLAAVGDDDVRVPLARLDESLVHGLDGGEILMDDAVKGAAALLDVPHQTAQDALVGVGVHEDLIVEHGAQLRLHEGQDLILINKSETSYDDRATLVINDSIGKVLGD